MTKRDPETANRDGLKPPPDSERPDREKVEAAGKEAGQIVEEARKQAEAEAEQMRSEAEAEAERIIREARADAEEAAERTREAARSPAGVEQTRRKNGSDGGGQR